MIQSILNKVEFVLVQLLFGSLLELLPNKYTVQPHRKMMYVYSTSCSACKRERESTVKRQHSIVLMTIVSKYTHIYITSRQKKKTVEGHNTTCKASAIVLASGKTVTTEDTG